MSNRLPARLLRAVACLAALAALVLGVPALLLSIPQPAALDDGLLQALTSPDDGSLLIGVLAVIGWALWAWFLCSLLVEAYGLLRHRRSPRMRGLAGGQRLAGFLLGGLLLLPSATAVAATPAQAAGPAAAATTPQSVHTAEANTSVSTPQQAPSASNRPVHTVGSTGETVWDIAEEHLGDGRRHAEIRELNPDLPQTATLPPGTTVQLPADALNSTQGNALSPAGGVAEDPLAEEPLHHVEGSAQTLRAVAEERLGEMERWSDIQALNPQVEDGQEELAEGTVLKMPSDTPPQESSGASAEEAEEYVVEEGDNLWSIAEEELGDGGDYQRIAKANDLPDPDLIYPDQHLTLPAQATAPPPATDDTGKAKPPLPHESPAPTDQGPEEEPEGPSAPAQGGEERADGGEDTASALPPETAAPSRPSPSSPSHETSSDAKTAVEAGEESSLPAVVAAAGGGLLIAGVLGGLVTRRVLQQRRRRRGRRIPMPTGRAAETEQDLRTTEPIDPSVLDRVLRTAAAGLAEQERELPALDAVVLGGDTAELHLSEPAQPVAPFTLLEDDPHTWVCQLNSRLLLDTETASRMEAPWPGLVTIGTTPNGKLVLVDLEEIRLLRLTGPMRHVLARSLAIELAVSQLADHLQLVLPESVTPGLADTSDRLEAYSEAGELVEPLQQHHAAQVAALDALEMERVRQARAADVGSGGWIPYIVVIDEAAAQDEELAAVRQVVTARPGASTAVVISTGEDTAQAPDSEGWLLHAGLDNEVVQLPGSGLEVRLNLFDDASYEDIVALLAQAEREADVPAPTPGVAADAVLPPAQLGPSCPEDLHGVGPTMLKTPSEEGSSSEPVLPPGRGLLAHLADDEPQDEEDEGGDQPSANPSGGEEAAAESEPETLKKEKLEDNIASAPRSTTVPAASTNAHIVHGRAQEEEAEGEGAEPAAPQAPLVQLLGPVEVVGAQGTALTSNRLSTATELVTWLVLHPNRDRQTIEEAVWRGREVRRKTVTELISRARAWLGTNAEGEPYFPVAGAGGRYRLHPHVTSDWHQFQQLVAHGQSTSGPEGARALRQALELVQSRPFSGIPATRYSWAESLMQEMISAIVDAAEVLSERCLVAGHPRDALWAVARGLEAGPEMEQLHRQRFAALRALGDIDGLHRAAADLEWENAQRGLETEEETHEMLRALLADV